MQSPAEEFRETKISMLNKDIWSLEKEIQMDKAIVEALTAEDPINDPNTIERLGKKLRINELRLASLKSDLHFCEQDPCIGSVHHARLGVRNSTSTASPKKAIVDIALVKMSCLAGKSPEEIFLKTNASDPRIEESETCNSWEVDSLGEGKNSEKHINVVAKISKSGAYSMGIVSKFRARIFELQKDGVKTKEEHYAWVILSPRRFQTPRESDMLDDSSESVSRFSMPGDSGSFIMAAADWEYAGYDNRVSMPSEEANRHADACQPFLVGLLFASEVRPDISYFTSFDLVKSEIESMTGEDMVWPQTRTEYLANLEEGRS